MGRRFLLMLVAGAAIALAAIALVARRDDGGDDTNPLASPGAPGVVTAVHTVPPLEPVVRGIVDTYNQTSGATVELAVRPQHEVIQAVSQGTPAIVPGAWLGGVNVDSTVIGRTVAIIAVPAGNPAQVTGVEAFAPGSGLDTAICGANSPFGNFAAIVLARGGVQPDPARVAEGCDADAVGRVARGELDAALVFRNNVPIPAGVEIVTIPDDRNLVIDIRYAPAAAGGNGNPFQNFLVSDQAKQLLTQQGYLP